MAVKSDGTRRWVATEVELPGTAEQVWQAVATGPGYSAWFVPAAIEEREGGHVSFDLGSDTSSGRVLEWQPPHRLVYDERGWSEGAPPLVTTVAVETLDGGTCRLRMVHALFTEATDWDDEIGSMENGWPPFFGILRLYLGHFAGLPPASRGIQVASEAPVDALAARLQDALGLRGAAPGAQVQSRAGTPGLAGTVIDRTRTPHGEAVTLRLDRPAPGAALVSAHSWGGQSYLSLSLYFYGAGAQETAAQEGAAWQSWLEALARGAAGDQPGP